MAAVRNALFFIGFLALWLPRWRPVASQPAQRAGGHDTVVSDPLRGGDPIARAGRGSGVGPYPRTMRSALVVDDDPSVGDVVSAYLERAGFEVRRAADGVLALALASAATPDVVILDLMLPG